MSESDFEEILQLQADRIALAAAKQEASREVHEAMQTSSTSKMATADSTESQTAGGLSIQIDQGSKVDGKCEDSKDLSETKVSTTK